MFCVSPFPSQGVSSMDYGRLANSVIKGVSAYSATGTAMSVICGRVSYTFRLKGAAVSVDTACSLIHVGLSSQITRVVLGTQGLVWWWSLLSVQAFVVSTGFYSGVPWSGEYPAFSLEWLDRVGPV